MALSLALLLLALAPAAAPARTKVAVMDVRNVQGVAEGTAAGSCVADAPVGAASGVCDLAAAEPRGCLGGFCATANGTCTSFIPESLPCLSTDQCGPGGLCNAGVAVCYKSCAP